MADLFVKQRNPDGTLGDLVPAFGTGKTTEERLIEAEIANDHLKKENMMLRAQNSALSNRITFHDDIMTEIILKIHQ